MSVVGCFLCRFDDQFDRQLFELLPVLVNHISDVRDVRDHLDASKPISWLVQDAQSSGGNSKRDTNAGDAR